MTWVPAYGKFSWPLYDLTASHHKPPVVQAVLDEDPAELIREVLATEHEVTAGLEGLLDRAE